MATTAGLNVKSQPGQKYDVKFFFYLFFRDLSFFAKVRESSTH